MPRWLMSVLPHCFEDPDTLSHANGVIYGVNVTPRPPPHPPPPPSRLDPELSSWWF